MTTLSQIIEECAERLSDEAVEELIACIGEHLGGSQTMANGNSSMEVDGEGEEGEAVATEPVGAQGEEEEEEEEQELGMMEGDDELVAEDTRHVAADDDGD